MREAREEEAPENRFGTIDSCFHSRLVRASEPAGESAPVSRGCHMDGEQPAMANPERIHRSRFELKYIVSERCAQAIRDFSRRYVEPDAYARRTSGYTYAVSSLYLDSPDLALCPRHTGRPQRPLQAAHPRL